MTFLVLALLVVPMVVTAVFVAELAAGLAPIERAADPGLDGRTVVLLMPAHDEGQIIGAVIDHLQPAIAGWARLLVVADNCLDDTAAIARAHGADVVERHDAQRRGKGFALDHGRAALRADPPDVVPDVVIVFDADCASDRDSLRALAASALAWQRPCQAIYLIEPAVGASPLVEVSNFAFMIKNLVRQRGLQRLSGRVHLVGTGMAFPWSIFAAAPLATASIVEDAELGLALERAGTAPQLVPGALVTSAPSSTGGTLIQRTRWEGGFLALAKLHAPAAIGRALRRFDPRALFAALDLAVPPITMLALIDAAAVLLAVAATVAGGAAWWPVLSALGLCLVAGLLIAVAWVREGRRFIGAATLLRIPLYMLWKIPLYLGLARGTPGEWLRPGR